MQATMESSDSTAPKANVAMQKRVYIGGLPRFLTAEDLKNRFKMFGEIIQASIAKDAEDQCRGFGHITINTTTNQWTKCLSVYNHAKWKGGVMKIEDAKPDYKEKHEAEKEQIKLKEQQKLEKAKKRRRTTDTDGFIAKDMTLVNDKNVDGRKGWKRGRYGRAIAVMRLQKNNGTKFVFDPVHYKNNLLKLYNIGVRMKPTRSLPMYYDDIMDAGLELYDHASDVEETDTRRDSDNDSDGMQIDSSIVSEMQHSKLMKEEVNEKRLATLRQREQERQQEKERIAAMLAEVESGKRKDGHITFEDDDEEPEGAEDDDIEPLSAAPKQQKDAVKWMFDSDDSDTDDTPGFDINPALEGERGRERLELQRTYGGDDRFKLGADFMNDDSDDDVPIHETANVDDTDAQDEISAELSQEKSTSMDVLKAMFGEDNRTALREAPKSVGWTPVLRFDPDAEDTDLLVGSSKPAEETDHSEEENANPQKEALPEVSTEKHYQVNINLKPLFTPGAQETPFKLFGGDSDTEDDEVEEPMDAEDDVVVTDVDDHYLVETKADKIIQSARPTEYKEKLVQNAPFFFFHFGNPELSKRSNYKDDGIFMRTESMDQITATWESVRQELTQVFKKKHKSATKLKAKMLRAHAKAD